MQQDNKFLYFLKRIWPTIYRIINTTVYFVFSIVRNLVQGALDQIRNF